MATEKFILFAARAAGALKTANEQNGHAYSHQDGQNVRIRDEPMSQAMHKRALPNPFLQNLGDLLTTWMLNSGVPFVAAQV